MSYRRWTILIVSFASLLISLDVRAKDGKPIDGDIARWLVQLSDRVPAVREAAQEHLRSIDREDLESLREAIVRNLPAARGHEELLQEIVEHVFLVEEPYVSEDQKGFLGVRFEEEQLCEPYDPSIFPYFGVEILHVFPGLAGSKYLEIGDVVMDIQIGAAKLEVGNATEMQTVVMRQRAGQKMTFTVLRRGRMLNIDVVLSAKPSVTVGDPQLLDFEASRNDLADNYWDEHFAPIFDGRLAAPAARVSAEP